MSHIQRLIPEHKSDFERAAAAIAAGYPAVAPILPELLGWLRDYNWPVAHVLEPFLTSIGKPLTPHLQQIFKTDDEVWKYWIIVLILQNSPDVASALREELERLADLPTEREVREELNEVALFVLQKQGLRSTEC